MSGMGNKNRAQMAKIPFCTQNFKFYGLKKKFIFLTKITYLGT